MYSTKTKQPETANSYIANSLSSLDIIETTSHRQLKLYCEHCGEIKTAIMKCSDRTCEFCRKRIYYKLLKGWQDLTKQMRNPKLLTLTTVNVDQLKTTDVQNIRKCFGRLIRQKYYKERITGGLYVIEIKNIGKGWNIHLHALIDTKDGFDGYMEQKKISADWLKITKTSKIVDIRRAKNPQISLRYILKYLIKTPEINGEVDTYNSALRGSRPPRARTKYELFSHPCLHSSEKYMG